jgi:hypothetical protein
MAIGESAMLGSTERRFYAWGAAAIVLVAFSGFARTYYLKGAFGTPPLPTLVHLHAAAMTAWIVLFVAQTRLIAARRTDWHRRVGVAGVLLIAAITVIGVLTAIDSARRGMTFPGMSPLVFLVLPLGTVFVFVLLAGCAIVYRRRSDFHKRLMLLATLSILTPAIARVPWEPFRAVGPPLFIGLTDALVLAFVVWDTVRNRRLHPAFGWGALFLFASQPLRMALAHTEAWARFASWLTQ